MGKSKKVSRNSSARVSAIQRTRVPVLQQKEASLEGTVHLVDKLTVIDPNERLMAIVAISNSIETSDFRQALLKAKLVQKLVDNCLSDSSDEVVMEAFGVLGNLALKEGYDVCVFVWRKDIVSIISACLVKVQKSLDTLPTISTIERNLLCKLVENILLFLTSLATSSDDIHESIVQRLPTLPSLTLYVISSNAIPNSVKVVAAENLYVLSELSLPYVSEIQSVGFVAPENLSVSVKIYLAGVQYNILEVSHASTTELLDVSRSIIALLKEVKTCNWSVDVETDTTVRSSTDQRALYEKLSARQEAVAAAQVGLELITAISEALVVRPGESRSQESVDIDSNEDEDMSQGDDEGSETAEHVVDEDFVMQSTDNDTQDENSIASLLSHGGLDALLPFMDMNDTRTHAFNALNNMMWTLSATAPHWALSSDISLLQKTLLSMRLTECTTDCRTGCIGALWAWSKSSSREQQAQIFDGDTIRYFINGFQQFSDDESVEYKVRLVGFLGVVAQKHIKTDFTKEISIFLLTQVLSLPNVEPVVVIEALNAIFDIFADKSYEYDNAIFVQGEFLRHLRNAQPKVTAMAKQIDRRKQFELREKADEVVNNLQRFIAYKFKEQQKV
ncbi:hypothetical protein V1512DRAFT_244450 [Lipomyces arxii]|uniref:uncharacterized protein n=1 Tax=Lipomyces arxii TaxID=56418 RepID=UPI0034CEC73B